MKNKNKIIVAIITILFLFMITILNATKNQANVLNSEYKTYHFVINYTIENKKIGFIEKDEYINSIALKKEGIPVILTTDTFPEFKNQVIEGLNNYIAESLIRKNVPLEDFEITINRMLQVNEITSNIQNIYLLKSMNNLCWYDGEKKYPNNEIKKDLTLYEKNDYFQAIPCE